MARRATTGRKPKAKPATPHPEKRTTPARSGSGPMIPPRGGAIVRMYRIGHGDCFLIALAGDDPAKPAYVLIDCGYKPGSPGKLARPTKAKDIGEHILATTGGFVDVAIVTHEHQDHVNGLTPANFPGLKVGEVWFAWTENPTDDLANALRKRFRDRLLGLIDARANLAGLGMGEAAGALDGFLELELGEAAEEFNGGEHRAASGKDPSTSANKLAMKFLRDCARGEPDYLYPHENARPVPGAKSARAFVLGPPRDMDAIDDLNPIGEESFGEGDGHGLAAGAGGTPARADKPPFSPFPRRHALPLEHVFDDEAYGEFFTHYYGPDGVAVAEAEDGAEIPPNAAWRRMTADDAADAGALALAMNNATNNSSLVLAFELSKGGKVLLFAADAQAGNWRSWSDGDFDDDGTKVTAKDLLARAVLYKVGHHGSHNATLKGAENSKKACLAWMAQGRHASEFVAMITAVEAWARQKPKPDWDHPLPAIKVALMAKADGRVLQTDSSVSPKPKGAGAAGWQAFAKRVTETDLYFDLTINP